jgi:hypothetical protein
MNMFSSTLLLYLVDCVIHGYFYLLKQEIKVDDLETKNIVLVNGGGFGAWCWYKTIALLEDSGFKVNAIDLAGSGIHSFDTNKITSISEYADPLTSFLENLSDGEKVYILPYIPKHYSYN